MEVTCSGNATIRTRLLTGKIFIEIFKKSCRIVVRPDGMAQVHRPDGVCTYYCSRPFCNSAYK